ncbi:MAG TPA: sialidase family protein [Gemmatimonadales bacterium]|jgi:hypothetical protein
MQTGRHVATLIALCGAAACGTAGLNEDLIFLDGRGVAAAGDSLLVVTRPDTGGVVVIDRRSGAVYRRASNGLTGPQHVQLLDDRWYVSDIRDGVAEIAVFTSTWQPAERISLNTRSGAAHQFAVLPDGRIIVEAPDGRLVAIDGDTVVTFALVEQSARTGLLIAAQGGVVHAVPDRSLTLYNGLGKVRWRLPWPWQPTAYVADLAVDPRGRIHILAGEGERQPTFVAFTISSITGEVVRWSAPGTAATFSVDRVGTLQVADPVRWLRDH